MAVDLVKFIEEVVEDKFYRNNAIRAAYNYDANSPSSLRHTFQRFVVLDVLVDRVNFKQNYIDELEKLYGEIDNKQHVTTLVPPRNTILAKPIYNSSAANKMEASKPMFLYPFFPSHLAMPCKPGEHVWVMFESVVDYKSLGYWMCRIVGPDHIDDVNHSHTPREYDLSFAKRGAQPADQVKPRYHFKNGIYKVVSIDSETGERETIVDPTTMLVLPPPGANRPADFANVYESILRSSHAAGKEIMEPVPRYNKNPGDLAIEGSNNTLVVLGTERQFSPRPTSAGSIDMVAGRGSVAETLGQIAANELDLSEIDKHPKRLVSREGAVDYANDRSRIHITQRIQADSAFSTKNYNENKLGVKDSQDGDAAVVIKTDKVRIIARSDVQLVVKNYSEELDPTGAPVKRDSTDESKWASITIKSNGDIVFSPSTTGYIKLGGDEADRAIMCTALPVVAAGGVIKGGAVLNNAGGSMCGSSGQDGEGKNIPLISPDHGTFASKVLVK